VRPAAAGALATCLVAVGGLAGCGGGTDTERYCSALGDRQDRLADLTVQVATGDPTAYDDLLAVWQHLHSEAPGDLEDEWTTLVFSLETFLEAVERTGVPLSAYDPDDPPEGASGREVGAVRDAAAELASPRVRGAAEEVEQHARDVCEADLSLTGGPGS
jgi:hypothetical protein